jgi:hypothetical protein
LSFQIPLTEVEFFNFADETFDVSHAEKFLDEWLRLEWLEVVNMLASTDEDY